MDMKCANATIGEKVIYLEVLKTEKCGWIAQNISVNAKDSLQ